MDGLTAYSRGVSKSLFLDVVHALNGTPNNIGESQNLSKIEGIAIGDHPMVGGTLTHTLWVANGNAFAPVSSGQNRFCVFGFTDGNPGTTVLKLEQIPETGSTGLLTIGAFGLIRELRGCRGAD